MTYDFAGHFCKPLLLLVQWFCLYDHLLQFICWVAIEVIFLRTGIQCQESLPSWCNPLYIIITIIIITINIMEFESMGDLSALTNQSACSIYLIS